MASNGTKAGNYWYGGSILREAPTQSATATANLGARIGAGGGGRTLMMLSTIGF
jgi:hypothetical protein